MNKNQILSEKNKNITKIKIIIPLNKRKQTTSDQTPHAITTTNDKPNNSNQSTSPQPTNTNKKQKTSHRHDPYLSSNHQLIITPHKEHTQQHPYNERTSLQNTSLDTYTFDPGD